MTHNSMTKHETQQSHKLQFISHYRFFLMARRKSEMRKMEGGTQQEAVHNESGVAVLELR